MSVEDALVGPSQPDTQQPAAERDAAELDAGVGFTLAVPESWFELPLSPLTRDAGITALVEQRVAAVPELREHRSTLARLLRRQAREAWESGARYCASMVEPTEDGPITASVVVSIVRGPLGVRPGEPEHTAALLAPLTPKTAASEDDTWRKVAPAQVPGAVGAARAWGVEDVDLPEDAGWVRTVSMQLLVPVPGTTRIVLVACSSPVVALAEPLLDVFDAICSTLTVVPSYRRPPADGPAPT